MMRQKGRIRPGIQAIRKKEFMKKNLLILASASLLMLSACNGGGGSSASPAPSVSSEESSESSSPKVVVTSKIASVSAIGGTETTNYVTMSAPSIGTKYNEGDKVTLTFAPGSLNAGGFLDVGLIFVYVNGTAYHPTLDKDSLVAATLVFDMPAEDVELSYCWSNNSGSWKISFDKLGSYKVRGLDLNQKYAAPVNFFLEGPENKAIKSLTAKTNTGDTGAITTTDIGGGVYSVSYQGYDADYNELHGNVVTFSIVEETATSYAITYTGLDDETKFDKANSIIPTVGYAGKKTKIAIADKGISYVSDVTFEGVSAYWYNGSAEFVMPENAVSIGVTFGTAIAASLTIENTTAIKKAWLASDTDGKTEVQYVKALDQVYLFIELADSSYSPAATFNGTAATYFSSVWDATTYQPIENKYYCSFTILGGITEAKFVANAVKSYTLTYAAPNNGTFSIAKGNSLVTSGGSVAAGATLTITLHPNDNASTNASLTFTDDDGSDITNSVGLSFLTVGGYSTYKTITGTFTMPEKNVTITATLSAPASEE